MEQLEPTSSGDTSNTLAEIELEAIAHDGWRLRQLVMTLQSRGAPGLLGPLLAPSMAFYAIETKEWLRRVRGGAAEMLLADHDSAFRALRARLKLFDDKVLGLDGLTRLLAHCERTSVEYFSRDHRGVLKGIKSWLQDDLGLFFLGHDLVLTSHIILANTSPAMLQKDAWPMDPFQGCANGPPELTIRLGQFLGGVTAALAKLAPQGTLPDAKGVPLGTLRRQDEKAGKLYPEITKHLGLPRPHAAPLSFVISQVNFVHRWLRDLLPQSEGLFFRIRFLTAHHALTSLMQLNASVRGDHATLIGRLAGGIVGSPEARRLRRFDTRLRRAVAHYDFGQLAGGGRTSSQPLEQLVETLVSQPFAEVERSLDCVLEMMSVAFRGIFTLRRTALLLEE